MKKMSMTAAMVIDVRASKEMQERIKNQPDLRLAGGVHLNDPDNVSSYHAEVAAPKGHWERGTAANAGWTEFLRQNALPRSEKGCFGKVCWDTFSKTHPEWDECKYTMEEGSVGAYNWLPTMDSCEKGTVLFVTEAQYDQLGKTPIIGVQNGSLNGYGDWREWCYRLGAVDYVVVIPEPLVKQAIEEGRKSHDN